MFLDYVERNDNEGFLSDILSALCEDTKRFPIYHEREYWREKGKKEAEVFANIFSLEAINDMEKLTFMEKNFPRIIDAYRRMISW